MPPTIPAYLRIILPSHLYQFATVLISIYLLFSVQLALAVDVYPDSILKADHNHHRLASDDTGLHVETLDDDVGWEEEGEGQNAIFYEAHFVGADRSIIGRATAPGHTALNNNAPDSRDVNAKVPIFYQFEMSQIFGNKNSTPVNLPSIPFEQDGNNALPDNDSGSSRTVYISINTCLQPKPNTTTSAEVPQLTMYISASTDNKMPGPSKPNNTQMTLPLVQGFAGIAIMASSDLFIGVWAQNTSFPLATDWSYEIAASIDGPYHQWSNLTVGPNIPILQFVDSDSTSALLVTTNLTSLSTSPEINEQWEKTQNPFSLFAFPNAFSNTSSIAGVQRSFCGLKQAFRMTPGNMTPTIDPTITTRGDAGLPKGQFYLQNLQNGTNYTAVMVMNPNSTNANVVGGGGSVWLPNNFTTKTDDNCALLFDLPFCSSIAYAAPYNPTFLGGKSNLSSWYNNNTESLYTNFNLSMQQVACNTTDTARYSLVANCDNCTAAYKRWLCAVSIPRCEDFSPSIASQALLSPSNSVAGKALMPRNLGQNFTNGTLLDYTPYFNDSSFNNYSMRLYTNSSRLPLIDQVVQPGPYLEFLPCDDLCYDLVRMCPASMQFVCPQGRMLTRSYGPVRQCNSPGSVFIVGAARRHGANWGLMISLALGVGFMVWG